MTIEPHLPKNQDEATEGGRNPTSMGLPMALDGLSAVARAAAIAFWPRRRLDPGSVPMFLGRMEGF